MNRLRTVSASWEVTSAVVVLALILVYNQGIPSKCFFVVFFGLPCFLHLSAPVAVRGVDGQRGRGAGAGSRRGCAGVGVAHQRGDVIRLPALQLLPHQTLLLAVGVDVPTAAALLLTTRSDQREREIVTCCYIERFGARCSGLGARSSG